MKKKNKKNTDIYETGSKHLHNQIKRREERISKQEEKREKSRNALFRKRVREASERKAPKTLRTKAYYRFSRDFPAFVTPDGFRENNPEKEKLSAGKKLTVFICCIAVFALTFIGVETAVALSEKPVPSNEDAPPASTGEAFLALHITPEELSSLSPDDIKAKVTAAGCNKAVFEFKSEYGYVYFDINSFVGGSADKRIGDAWDKINTLREMGIGCVAYISCFKDTIAASSLEGMEIKNSDDSVFLDNDGFAWLDPFSQESTAYVQKITEKALEGGFEHIILDNICFPSQYSTVPPVLGGNDSDTARNAVLRKFIDNAVSVFGNDKLIIMSTVTGFSAVSDAPGEKYGGTLMLTNSISHAADVRVAAQETQIIEGSELFGYIDEMPKVFMLDAGDIAARSLKASKEATCIYAVTDSHITNSQELLNSVNIENIIFW